MEQRVVKFKPYYVVWKHIFLFIYLCGGKKFKPYYVVWKPITSPFELSSHLPFKPYYVVWKPESFPYFFCPFIRLNRTM